MILRLLVAKILIYSTDIVFSYPIPPYPYEQNMAEAQHANSTEAANKHKQDMDIASAQMQNDTARAYQENMEKAEAEAKEAAAQAYKSTMAAIEAESAAAAAQQHKNNMAQAGNESAAAAAQKYNMEMAIAAANGANMQMAAAQSKDAAQQQYNDNMKNAEQASNDASKKNYEQRMASADAASRNAAAMEYSARMKEADAVNKAEANANFNAGMKEADNASRFINNDQYNANMSAADIQVRNDIANETAREIEDNIAAENDAAINNYYQDKANELEKSKEDNVSGIKNDSENIDNLKKNLLQKEYLQSIAYATANEKEALADAYGTGSKLLNNPAVNDTAKLLTLEGQSADKAYAAGVKAGASERPMSLEELDEAMVEAKLWKNSGKNSADAYRAGIQNGVTGVPKSPEDYTSREALTSKIKANLREPLISMGIEASEKVQRSANAMDDEGITPADAYISGAMSGSAKHPMHSAAYAKLIKKADEWNNSGLKASDAYKAGMSHGMTGIPKVPAEYIEEKAAANILNITHEKDTGNALGGLGTALYNINGSHVKNVAKDKIADDAKWWGSSGYNPENAYKAGLEAGSSGKLGSVELSKGLEAAKNWIDSGRNAEDAYYAGISNGINGIAVSPADYDKSFGKVFQKALEGSGSLPGINSVAKGVKTAQPVNGLKPGQAYLLGVAASSRKKPLSDKIQAQAIDAARQWKNSDMRPDEAYRAGIDTVTNGKAKTPKDFKIQKTANRLKVKKKPVDSRDKVAIILADERNKNWGAGLNPMHPLYNTTLLQSLTGSPFREYFAKLPIKLMSVDRGVSLENLMIPGSEDENDYDLPPEEFPGDEMKPVSPPFPRKLGTTVPVPKDILNRRRRPGVDPVKGLRRKSLRRPRKDYIHDLDDLKRAYGYAPGLPAKLHNRIPRNPVQNYDREENDNSSNQSRLDYPTTGAILDGLGNKIITGPLGGLMDNNASIDRPNGKSKLGGPGNEIILDSPVNNKQFESGTANTKADAGSQSDLSGDSNQADAGKNQEGTDRFGNQNKNNENIKNKNKNNENENIGNQNKNNENIGNAFSNNKSGSNNSSARSTGALVGSGSSDGVSIVSRSIASNGSSVENLSDGTTIIRTIIESKKPAKALICGKDVNCRKKDRHIMVFAKPVLPSQQCVLKAIKACK